MQDEKFYNQVKEILGWKNTKGNWTTFDDFKLYYYGPIVVPTISTSVSSVFFDNVYNEWWRPWDIHLYINIPYVQISLQG